MTETRELYLTMTDHDIVTRWMRRAVLLSDTLRTLGYGDVASAIMRMSADECEMEIRRRVANQSEREQ